MFTLIPTHIFIPLNICHAFLDQAEVLVNFLRMSRLKSPAPARTPMQMQPSPHFRPESPVDIITTALHRCSSCSTWGPNTPSHATTVNTVLAWIPSSPLLGSKLCEKAFPLQCLPFPPTHGSFPILRKKERGTSSFKIQVHLPHLILTSGLLMTQPQLLFDLHSTLGI